MTDHSNGPHNTEAWQHQRQVELELMRAVTVHGTATLKALFLMNGGAAVALLAFAGHLWSRSEGVPDNFPHITDAMWTFLVGVFVSASAAATTYLTDIFNQMMFLDPPRQSAWRKVAFGFHGLTIALSVGGLLTFLWGAWLATQALSPSVLMAQ